MSREKQCIKVRKAVHNDAKSMASIYFNTIRTINSKDYNASRIEAWSGPAPDPEKWMRRLKKNRTFTACIGDEVVGFAEFEPDGYIDAFYVHHKFQGKGVASLLLNQIEAEAVKLGVSKLYLEASITALPFFLRRGFRVLKEQDVWRNGEMFRNYQMEKLNKLIVSQKRRDL
jgi:putative acetyltransferase